MEFTTEIKNNLIAGRQIVLEVFPNIRPYSFTAGYADSFTVYIDERAAFERTLNNFMRGTNATALLDFRTGDGYAEMQPVTLAQLEELNTMAQNSWEDNSWNS